ncbi:unnamed protein product [Meganyctiphanes norvegica]|uniref:Uncharacterized protein n=1 Tax=Meganyctiphanes norvegica TaxID=48144 RepID=A0AAV2RFB3_MEGNR
MPPFVKIKSLYTITLDWFEKHLLILARTQNGPAVRMKRRKFLAENVSYHCRQMILNRILDISKYKCMYNYKLTLLEMLADENTIAVDFSKSGSMYIDDLFQLYRVLFMSKIINIFRLGINVDMPEIDRKYLGEINIKMYKMLTYMRNLRWVTLNSIANLAMIRTLGAYAHHLEYLDVSRSYNIFDDAAPGLLIIEKIDIEQFSEAELIRLQVKTTPCANKLKYICFSETFLGTKGAIIFLKYAPNLRSLGGPSNGFSTSELVSWVQPPGKLLKLNLVSLNDGRLLRKNAENIPLFCPDLEEVSISASSIPSLVLLQPISKLTIDMDYKAWADDIWNYIWARGEFLKELILQSNINGPIELGWFVDVTPNLEVLTACLECHYPSDYFGNWDQLKTADIVVRTSKCLMNFTLHAPNLENLNIWFEPPIRYIKSDEYKCINDDLFVVIVIEGGLRKLKKLIINKCSIGPAGVECLLLNCPDLSCLGYLREWENFTEEDIEKLKARAIVSNWELDLKYAQYIERSFTCCMDL